MPPDRGQGREGSAGERDDERALEHELRDLGARIEYPPTPDLASSVKSRLDVEGGTPAVRSGPSLWWVAAAAALVLLMVLPIFSPTAREMASSVFSGGAGGMAGGASGSGGGAGAGANGGREITTESGRQAAGGMAASGSAGAAGGEETLAASGSEGQMADAASAGASAGAMESEDLAGSAGGGGAAAGAASVPSGDASTACATQDGCPKGSPLGKGLGLGEKIPLREARARSEAPILLPRSPRLGSPDEAYARGRAPSFAFLYRAPSFDRAWSGLPRLGDTRIGLILTQTPGDVGAAYLPGGTVEGPGLQTVNINGEEGHWIPASGVSPEVARSAGLLANVLLWERDGQALRLEADVSKEEAVRIAESVR